MKPSGLVTSVLIMLVNHSINSAHPHGALYTRIFQSLNPSNYAIISTSTSDISGSTSGGGNGTSSTKLYSRMDKLTQRSRSDAHDEDQSARAIDDALRQDAVLGKTAVIKNMEKALVDLDEELAYCGKNRTDIRELTVSQARKYFKSGELNSVGLTICYLRRIYHMNPMLKAVIEVNPQAVKQALTADLEMKVGIDRGYLHGIPILIKDNIATDDEMETTSGSLALVGLKPKKDARVVKKLRAAGVVLLGKTNLSEFAFFRGTNVPDGWSSRGGQTVCPYVTSVTPSGSSSGSAVAVAANLCLVALGTETDGSIAGPSARQAVYGLKPTKAYDLISTKGVIPLSFTQDVVGPMARTAADVGILLQAISDDDKVYFDECSLHLDNCVYTDDVKKFRVGILRDPYWNTSDPILAKHMEQLEELFKGLRNTGRIDLIDNVAPKPLSFQNVSSDAELIVFYHEFKFGINNYLNKLIELETEVTRDVRNLSDIIRFNEDHPTAIKYNQVLLKTSDATDGIDNATYRLLKDSNIAAAKEFLDFVFQEYDLDAVIGPCDEGLSIPPIFSVAAVAGYPSITVPAGFTKEGVPFGATFVGKAFSEIALLKISWLLEQSHSVRKPPQFLK